MTIMRTAYVRNRENIKRGRGVGALGAYNFVGNAIAASSADIHAVSIFGVELNGKAWVAEMKLRLGERRSHRSRDDADGWVVSDNSSMLVVVWEQWKPK
jgi:hypothetical protein